jgi:hypothetical protein
MNDTTFDPERFQLPPEVASELAKAKPKRQGARPKRAEPFLQITHKAFLAGGRVLRGTKQFLVWLLIHHRVWADNSKTVVIGNQTLKAWGVGRNEKYKALRQLEGANLVTVEWRSRRSPLVTLLTKP